MGVPRLSVVMVNYNTTTLAADALRSLRSRVDPDDVQVVVVDNATTGFDPGPLLDAWPGVEIVEAPENLGFGRANNLGAARCRADHLWLLNTDTCIPDDCDPWTLVEFLEGHPLHAAVSPLLVDAAGSVQPWQTGHFPSLWRMAAAPAARAVARLLPRLGPRLAVVDTNFLPLADTDVDQVVAAAVVIRRTAFDEVGGFSPDYFFFLEDTDLCRKLRGRGWLVRWQPSTRVVHLWGGSVADPRARQRMFFDAQDIYFQQWHAPWERAALKVMRRPLTWRHRVSRRPGQLATP